MLFIVLFFTLLLTASIATFVKRATVDAILSRNRDAMSRTEALARGGVELAKALLAQDFIADRQPVEPGASTATWTSGAKAANIPIEIGNGARLRLRIEDSGSRLNLNALFTVGPEDGWRVSADNRTDLFLLEFIKKLIDELPVDEKGTLRRARARREPDRLHRSRTTRGSAADSRTTTTSSQVATLSRTQPTAA